MDKVGSYTEEELKQLHAVLHEILAEIVRVCNLLNIPYFITGGTVIGAKFWGDIIAWDDDIDVGMKRENYNRFIQEAPKVLKNGYFLQWYGSEPHTTFYFAKVRKDGTTFEEDICKGLKMHQGVYIDIFPFDKVPDNASLRNWQRKLAIFLSSCITCKELWPYKYFGKCSLRKPWQEDKLHVFIKKIVSKTIGKNTLCKLLYKVETLFNDKNVRFYNQVMVKSELIPVNEIDKTKIVKFGEQSVAAPWDIDSYLKRHYGKVEKYPPIEMRVTHRPVRFSLTSSIR